MPKGSLSLSSQYKPNLHVSGVYLKQNYCYKCANAIYTDFIAILVYILYNVLLTCHLHIYNSNSFLIHPLYEFNCAPRFQAQLEPFGINKIYGKCFYTDFIAILVYILYNELVTCHLHIYNNNSF